MSLRFPWYLLRMRRATSLLTMSLCLSAHADTIFYNGNMYYWHRGLKRLEAIRVQFGRIKTTGTNERLLREADAFDRCIDLQGRTVLPGLIDAHGHLLGLGAFGLGRLDLTNAASFSDVVGAVKDAASRAAPNEWILGGRWDHESWPEKNLPTHAPLSAVSPHNPVWLRRVDGHAGIANAAALRLAAITRSTPSPPGGEIIKDTAGNPTGVLIDNAMDLLDKVLPDQSESTADLLLKAQEMCFSVGLTCVHDMGVSPQEIAVYKQLEAEGKLKLRVHALVSSPYAIRYFEEQGIYHGDRLTVRGAKAYMDGAMGSRGAWLLEPYADRPIDDHGKPYTGLAVSDPQDIQALAEHAIDKGYQLCVHAIGDRANREVLDAFERASDKFRQTPESNAKRLQAGFRVEHAQLLHPDDIQRFSEHSKVMVFASMQPTHCTSDMRWVEARVGPERAKGAYAWASLLRADANIAFGSDFPVESHNPFLGFYAAVTRQDLEGNPPGGWRPEERVSREEALMMFTAGGAYLAYREAQIGWLQSGLSADFIVLDRDPMTCDVRDIPGTRVLQTVIAGETVFSAD
jgi:hypothetical protein